MPRLDRRPIGMRRRRTRGGVAILSGLVFLARPEAEGMRNDLRRGARSSLPGIAQTGADCAVYGLLEWNAKLLGALLEETRKVVIERESNPHV